MKQKTGRKLLSFLLSLALVLGLMPGMSLTAYADTKTITWNNSTIGTLVQNKTYTDANGITVSGDDALTKNWRGQSMFSFENYDGVDNVVFSLSNGNFTSIVINCSDISIDEASLDNGFTQNGNSVTWSGNANTITLKAISDYGFISFFPTSIVFTIEVDDVNVSGVSLSQTEASMTVGGTQKLTATVSHENAADETVKWSVSGDAVKLYADEACETEIGEDATETLTVYAKGIAAGNATVTATSNADSEKKASCEVTVTDPLADAKTSAKADLDTLQNGKNQNDYDAADWTTLTQAITDGKIAIDNATTTEAVTTAKNNAVDAVNAVKTKAQKVLDNAKTSAVNTVNAVNANDYIAADQQTVTDAKTTALAAIEAATTEEEVTTALNNFNNAIASCTTQVVADQIAQVMSEVSAKTGSGMTYTGNPIQLINTPTTKLPAGYKMVYAVTTENKAPTDENLYTTSIPTATTAGTYYVWYKVVGDVNHNDVDAECIEVTIEEEPAKEEPAKEEPKEEPAKEEPAKEEPKEEPAKEEPKPEEPVVLKPEDLDEGEMVADNDGLHFYIQDNGDVTCYTANDKEVYRGFACDGTDTYFFQYDGTAMRDRLTYEPEGKYILYFDEQGHEVFNDYAHVKHSIEGEEVDDYCFFDVYGHMYVDVLTWDQTGTKLLYANPYGVLEVGKWFQFSETVVWADGTPVDEGMAGGYGYAMEDATLMRDQYTYDWEGRPCYMQGNGVALY